LAGFWPDPSALEALLRLRDLTWWLFETFSATLVMTKVMKVTKMVTMTKEVRRLSLKLPERPPAQNLTLRLTLRKRRP
jgi:hypothetical protein